MATTELSQSTPASAGEKLRLALETGIARLVAVWRAARNRRSVARLLEWDDHMLRDIGLTQGDVHSALATKLGDDPSSHLRSLSLERHRAVRAMGQERLAQQSFFLRPAADPSPARRRGRRSA